MKIYVEFKKEKLLTEFYPIKYINIQNCWVEIKGQNKGKDFCKLKDWMSIVDKIVAIDDNIAEVYWSNSETNDSEFPSKTIYYYENKSKNT